MSIYHRKSPEELALVQGYVDAIYEGFLDRVTAGRPLERAALMEIAQGRVWSGSRALELGLVDALGGLDAAIELCATELDAESWRVDWLEEELSGLDVLLKDLTAPEDYPVVDLGMPEALQPVLRGWRNWNRYAEQPGVYARLPYELRIR
jgi:protease-4